jgi:hypothetical protein
MPNTARLAPAAFLPLMRVPPHPVFAREEQGVPAGLIAVLAAAFVLPTASVVVPGLDLLWLSRNAATLVARHLSRPGEAVLSVGYSEPSLVFLLGTATRLAAAAPGDRQLAGGHGSGE